MERQDVDVSEGEDEEGNVQPDQALPEKFDSHVKQENVMNFIVQDEKFQDCEEKEYKCDCGKVRCAYFHH